MHQLYALLLLLTILPVWAQSTHTTESHKYSESTYVVKNLMTLSQAIQRAFEASPRLQAARAQVSAAQGTQKQANYWLNPNVEFEVENFAGNNSYQSTKAAEYTYSISQTIEMGGKRTARIKSAKAGTESSELLLQIEKNNLARDVHAAYLSVLGAEEIVEVTLEQVTIAREILKNVSYRVSAAREPEIQLEKAKVASSIAQIRHEKARKNLNSAKQHLAYFWNESELSVSLDHAYFFSINPPKDLDYYYTYLQKSPELTQYHALSKQRKSNLALEKSRPIPDPSFNVGFRNFRENESYAFLVRVSIPLPAFDRNQGNIARAISEIVQVDSQRKNTEIMLKQLVNEHWHNCQSTFREAELLKSNVLPSAKKAFSSAYDGYQKGKYSYIEVLDAQRTLSEIHSQYYEALKSYHISNLELERISKAI